ncbi:hypothetical protein M011DRAFT_471782 [Sporormia fimetaria CBS 119925]|uniref:Uncharacterized protein n=1 Tax=Sporormia fimetaria CBS 119925 TaxID=1340428 RepID=A0A6A6V090_9PLEO|nr:hypothetical protein M011DRAFT_471782 [Sporormia fimetaria CBS 119925]
MIRKRQGPETAAVTTVTGKEAREVTVFAEKAVATPSVGSVWGYLNEGPGDRAVVDFIPGSLHTIADFTFNVDDKWEYVTWKRDGEVTGTIELPIVVARITSAGGTTAVAPETTAGVSDAPSSESNTGAEAPAASDTRPRDSSQPEPKSKSSIGPIVGGAVGGVAALAVIILLVWFLLRRRQKKRQAGAGLTSAPRTDDDKYPVEQHAGTGFNKPTAFPSTTKKYPAENHSPLQHHVVPELSPNGLNRSDIPAHELDPAKGTTAVMTANELGYGPGQQPPTGIKRVPVPAPASELQSANQAYSNNHATFGHELGQDGSEAEFAAQAQPQHGQEQTPSPYVDAQRRREIEWLESEEAKLRSRRELLRQQGQG